MKRTVLVTGAAGGLGRAFAGGFADAGWDVAVGDIDLAGATGTAEVVSARGARAWAGLLDVTSEPSVTSVAAAVADFGGGRIDAVVNNAGVFAHLQRGPFENIEPAEFDRVLAVNVKGPWLVTRACSRHLPAGGSVVNVASTTALSGSPNWLHYVTSKGAVIAMTRAMATELGAREITVNTVAPGFTVTDAALSLRSDAARHGVQQRAIQRAAVPDDIVGAVLYLTSGGSRFVTGQTLVVDGGRQYL